MLPPRAPLDETGSHRRYASGRARALPAPVRPARARRDPHPRGGGGCHRHLDRPAGAGLLLARRRHGRLSGARPGRRPRLCCDARGGCDRPARRRGHRGARAAGGLVRSLRLADSPCPRGCAGGRGDPRQRRLPLRRERRNPALRQPPARRRRGHRTGGRGQYRLARGGPTPAHPLARDGLRSPDRAVPRRTVRATGRCPAGARRPAGDRRSHDARRAAGHGRPRGPRCDGPPVRRPFGPVADRHRDPRGRRGDGRPVAVRPAQRAARGCDRRPVGRCLRRGRARSGAGADPPAPPGRSGSPDPSARTGAGRG